MLLHGGPGGEDAEPVDEVEAEEQARQDEDHDLLDGLPLLFLAPPEAVEHVGKLEQDEEDENDAHQHPDVQVANVTHLWKV